MRLQDNAGEDLPDETERLIGGSEDDREPYRRGSLLDSNIFRIGSLSLVLFIYIAVRSGLPSAIYSSTPQDTEM